MKVRVVALGPAQVDRGEAQHHFMPSGRRAKQRDGRQERRHGLPRRLGETRTGDHIEVTVPKSIHPPPARVADLLQRVKRLPPTVKAVKKFTPEILHQDKPRRQLPGGPQQQAGIGRSTIRKITDHVGEQIHEPSFGKNTLTCTLTFGNNWCV